MITRTRFVLVYLLLILTWCSISLYSRSTVPVSKPLAEFPSVCREWRMTSQTRFSDNILNILMPTDYLSRTYEGTDGKRIALYIGYHDGGKKSGDIHSPKHCLPGSGWQQISTAHMELAEPLGAINLVKAVYEKGGSKELFFYWFQVQDKTLSNEYALKVSGIKNSIFLGRKDAAFIRISVPFEENEKEATTTGIDFVHDIYPLIRDFIPS